MKPGIFLSLLLLQQVCNAQVVRIPDPNFKQRVIALGFDTNGDNQIQASEAQKVTKLYVDNLGIVNLEGINQFTNLEELGCYNNLLASLDVSKLKKLKYLYAYNNKITTLNITGLTQLEHLYVQNNIFIASLDVSKMLELKELYFSDNRITSLDVSGLNLLEKIEGENNRISTVTLRKAPNLKSVNLKNNQMSVTVDIRGLTNLEHFNFEGSQLIFMNFTGTVNLKTYYW